MCVGVNAVIVCHWQMAFRVLRGMTGHSHGSLTPLWHCVCVCVCVCVRACAHVHVCACLLCIRCMYTDMHTRLTAEVRW